MQGTTITPEDDMLSVPEAARALGKGRYTIVRLIAAGDLIGRRGPGRTLIVTRSSVEAYKQRARPLDHRETQCAAPAA